MEIFGETIERELPDLAQQGVRTRFIGRRDRAPDALREQMEELEARDARPNDRLQLWIAFDYGGRAELVEAARRLVEDGLAAARRRRGRARGAALRARAARARPPDPHLRRAADLELPALAARLRRARLHRHALARLRRGRPRGTRSPSTRAGAGGSAAGDAPFVSRVARRGRRRCRSCSASSGSAAGGSSASPLVAAPRRAARALRDGARPAAARARGLRGRARDAARRAARRARSGCSAASCSRSLLAFVLFGFAETRQSATVAIALDVLGVAWVGLGLGHLLLLRDMPEHGRLAVFTVLLAVFADDTAAYFVGRLVGRHKLAPALSPGKTWEGFVAGTAAAIAVAFFALYEQGFLTIPESLALGAAIALAGAAGDLFESASSATWGSRTPGGCSAATAACSTASTRCSSPAVGGVLRRARIRRTLRSGHTVPRETRRAARRHRLDRPAGDRGHRARTPSSSSALSRPGRRDLAALAAEHGVAAHAGRRRPDGAARSVRAGRRAERRRRLRRRRRDAVGARARRHARAREQGEPRRRRRARARRAGAGRRAAAAGRQRALGALPVPRRARRADTVDSLVLTASGGPFRGRTRAELAERRRRGGARASDLEHGAEDHRRLGDAREQGPRADRGALPLRPPVRPDRGRRAPDARSCTRSSASATAPRSRTSATRTCACRSRSRSPIPERAATRRCRGSTSPAG